MNIKNIIGLGIAGKFSGHLDQAGEMKDFLSISSDNENLKGIFPFYIPDSDGELSTYPYSDKIQRVPQVGWFQLEPGIIFLCDVKYYKNNMSDIIPISFSIFNDCTLRNDSAIKILEKKNWGKDCKGLSLKWISIDGFNDSCILNSYSLASFIKRNSILYPYSVDSEINKYSFFNDNFLEWIVTTINYQVGEGSLDNIHEVLKMYDYPDQLMIAIGADEYENFGKDNYLIPGDEITVVAYRTNTVDIDLCVMKNEFPEDSLWLKQLVEY